MNFTTLEIILISIQVLLIPLVRYVLEQNRKDITNQLLGVLNEHYSSLDNLIEHNKDMIRKLECELEYKAKLVKLRNRTIIARLTDLEGYLAKTSNFQPKSGFFFESDFDNEDNDHSGSF